MGPYKNRLNFSDKNYRQESSKRVRAANTWLRHSTREYLKGLRGRIRRLSPFQWLVSYSIKDVAHF